MSYSFNKRRKKQLIKNKQNPVYKEFNYLTGRTETKFKEEK